MQLLMMSHESSAVLCQSQTLRENGLTCLDCGNDRKGKGTVTLEGTHFICLTRTTEALMTVDFVLFTVESQ